MTFAADSPLALKVVESPSSERGPRPNGAGDIRGITIHMAEGGGTVPWLTRPDGNSSHYVVQYDGDIVQMVPERQWAGSINPRLLRNDNDPPYDYLGETIVYGRRAALDALGNGADDPNRYVIAIETEGFAADGPNDRQRASLAALVNDIRRRRGALPTLGHRDFQNYKKCPGKKIPWADYGGHAEKVGYAPPGESVQRFLVNEERTLAAVKTGAWLYDNSGLNESTGNIQISPGRELVYVGRFSADPDIRIVAYETADGDDNPNSWAYFTPATNISGYRVPAPPATDCTAAVKAATDPLKAQLAAEMARANAAESRVTNAKVALGCTP